MFDRAVIRLLAFLSLMLAATTSVAAPIDRHALVTRHSPTLTSVDPSAPFMVGNGSIALTADITGLQTFQDQYSPLVPLMTQAQWAWHSFPNPKGFRIDDAMVSMKLPGGGTRRYPALTNWDQAQAEPIKWLRENPHRFNLGRLGLYLAHADGRAVAFADLADTRQRLDLWTGRLTSRFTFDGVPVEIETSVHPERDIVIVRLRTALLSDGRAGVDLRFPGVAANLNPDPSDWTHVEAHATQEVNRDAKGLLLTRTLDDTRYSVRVAADHELDIDAREAHHYRLTAPGAFQLTLLVEFSSLPQPVRVPPAEPAREAVAAWWQAYWHKGGVVDFTGSRDPRAAELERRIVLSQYLAALNGAGYMPPQEEGLFSNSWNGKSHLEMHVWHSAHFAAWGHPELLARSMDWYLERLDGAKRRARENGVRGAWWPKMVGPEGRESPSTVNPFIMWQQPHPIYLAELLYRAAPDEATLEKYAPLVFATADLLASWARLEKSRKEQRYVLGPPMIPAQENFAPSETFNPTFELEYWRFGLETAQAWRERLGQKRNAAWDRVLAHLSKLPQKDGLYLAAESQPDLWEHATRPGCKAHAAAECPNRDHPSFVAAFGYLPGRDVDHATMSRTLDAVLAHWDLRQTWGWDWPMLAMTATRVGRPGLAVDFLLTDQKNFQFGVSGMTPRVHVVADDAPHAAGIGVDGPGYRRAAETYFPSNGSLLLAVALMVAGDGAGQVNPGFPKDGNWVVNSEGILPLP
ncbi:MAG TPA: hypothetical protein VF033_01750 [Steroidobacteraceae bacterium]